MRIHEVASGFMGLNRVFQLFHGFYQVSRGCIGFGRSFRFFDGVFQVV